MVVFFVEIGQLALKKHIKYVLIGGCVSLSFLMKNGAHSRQNVLFNNYTSLYI